MADLQNQFIQFHEAIKLSNENKTLSEKRERILRHLSEGIARLRNDGEPIPSYSHFNQGSYAMGTGIKPLDGDYDIDVAIEFHLAKNDYPDPVVVKKWVRDAIHDHTNRVDMRNPCVTVFYFKNNQIIYHVDLAIYSRGEDNPDGKNYLARGKEHSQASLRYWEESDPKGLKNAIASRFHDDDAQQFRRVIRYLKRWKDARQVSTTGIALTLAAYHWFSVSRTSDPFNNRTTYNDLDALLRLVEAMQARFAARLQLTLPVAPYNDVCADMTDGQMQDFKSKLGSLRESLRSARDDVDPHTACKELRKRLGDDFPVPDKRDTAKPQTRAISSSGNAA